MKKVLLALAFAAAVLLASCAKKELAVGNTVSKKIDGDKLKLVVLAVNEHDGKGNIIHKTTGTYRDMAVNASLTQHERRKAFAPTVYGKKDVYYDNEYDASGNLVHCIIHREGESDVEYAFAYDESGKVRYSKASLGNGDYESYYEYGENGWLVHSKTNSPLSHAYAKDLEMDEFTDTNYTYDENAIKVSSPVSSFLYGELKLYYSSEDGKPVYFGMKKGSERALFVHGKETAIQYEYGKRTRREYYRNYDGFYDYSFCLGDENAPVGLDGMVHFVDMDCARDVRTVIEYVLRDDGTVEKSIEYTGKREVALYERVKIPGIRKVTSPFPTYFYD